MEMMPILPETEVEATAALHLGRLLFVFGRMELDVGLALVNAQPAGELEREIVKVEQLDYEAKLRAFEALVLPRHADDAPALARWRRWFAAAYGLRKLRNDFARGRWGFQNMQQQIVHASNLPGSPNRDEVRYTLPGFAARVAEAEDVADEFNALTSMYPLDPGHGTVTKNP